MKSKILLGVALATAIFIGSPNISYADYPLSQRQTQQILGYIDGDWYDAQGHLILKIHDGYINGCQVLTIKNLVGKGGRAGGTVEIQEDTGVRRIMLGWNVMTIPGRSNDKDYIIMNDEKTLHRTSSVSYYESIAGLHLRMAMEDVYDLSGKADRILTPQNPIWIGGHEFDRGWYYEKKGLIVSFLRNTVSDLTIVSGSSFKFDKSGLGIENYPSEYARAYDYSGQTSYGNAGYRVPVHDGEFMYFGGNREFVSLSIFSN